LAGADIPDGNDLIKTGGDQLARGNEPLAVRTESDAAGELAAPARLEGAHPLAAGRVPEHDLLIPAGRGEPFAVGTEGDALDVILTVSAKRVQFRARGHVPDAYGPVVVSGSEPLTVATEGDASDFLGVALEGAQRFDGTLRLLSAKGRSGCEKQAECNDQHTPAMWFHDLAPFQNRSSSRT